VNEADFTAVADDTILRNAQARGLLVHTWTFRNEPRRLARSYAGAPAKEYEQFFTMGIDGLFSDFSDTAVTARDAYWDKNHN
jgi:glycerophosphoryl diester phosphodiesterase